LFGAQEFHNGFASKTFSQGSRFIESYSWLVPEMASRDHRSANLERRQRMADAFEFGFDILGGRNIAVGQMPKVQLDAGLQAPFQRHFIDGP
jgi:hypothetical protein